MTTQNYLTLRTATGVYFHTPERDIQADLVKADKPYKYPRRAENASIPELAARAADHYMALERAPGARNVKVHVFPAKKTGNSADFRRHLAAKLAGYDADRPHYVGSKYICKNEELREFFETRAYYAGFEFVEVDPADWQGVKK